MTEHEDFLSGLDDPAGEPTRLPPIDGVMSRGRTLRARRHAAMGASALAVVGVVSLAAVGVMPHLTADRQGNHVVPATQPPTSATPSPSPTESGGDTQVLPVGPAPGGQRHTSTHPTSGPAPTGVPAADPCAGGGAAPPPVGDGAPAADPSASTEPTASPVAAPSATPTAGCPSPTASPTASAEPSATSSPSASVSASPSEQAALVQPTTAA